MNEKEYYIPIILGTVRQGRESEKVARFLLTILENYSEVRTELIDPRNLDLPMDDEGTSLRGKNKSFKKKIELADGLLIVCPEYNHGYPGSLKRTLDVLSDEYNHKACALVGVSSGGFGGCRALESLAGVCKALGLCLIRKDLNFSDCEDVFDKKGEVKDKSYYGRTEELLAELLWLSKALRWGRVNLN